jgi:D-serine deaminase-like pyridoxal phosphate-dependent protein
MDSTLDQIETPAMLLDAERLRHNIRSIQELANSHKLNLRPHIKTHKCLEIGRIQMEEGAVGITAAKTDEALPFIQDGIPSVTIAYPLVVDSKLDRLVQACQKHGTDLRLVVDSAAGKEAIARAGQRHGARIGVFLKIDVGLHRCGLAEDDPRLPQLAQDLSADSALDFCGILAHAGHVYGAQSRAAAQDHARQELEILGRVRGQLESSGIEVAEVSIGSTPTILAAENFAGATELRPGNYVFMDRTPLRLELIEDDRIALSVLATVVSANQDYFIIDSGSKTLSSDQGAHGIAGMEGYGLAYPADRFQDKEVKMVVAKLSEEHGFVKRNGCDLSVGSQVRIVPNHSCTVANLLDPYLVVRNDEVVDQWRVAARGQVH